MNLKIGGSNVGKIMYGGQEFGGATKLEPGTGLYMSKTSEKGFKDVHLLSTTKNWNNLNGINVKMHSEDFKNLFADLNITGDDFKNLNKAKEYKIVFDKIVTISRSIVNGEYRLNIPANDFSYRLEIIAL